MPNAALAPSRTVQVPLSSADQAPAEARRGTKSALLAWSLPALVDDATLVVSELVTNAVLHGAPPLQLVLRRRLDDVRLDVQDANPQPPPREQGALPWDEHGRGLAICRAVADDVGWEDVPGNGKTVYALFALQH
jgi:anti-sigma regulatory factor (Ser/Thr protein kinase)